MTTFFGTDFRRVSLAVAIGVIAVGTAVVLPVSVATASPSGSASAHEPHPLAMGTFSAASYATAAARLPLALGVALQRDVGLSSAQYLANSAAAARAVAVVASLRSAGVHVLGSHMNATALTVNVASSADIPTVTAAGAIAVVGAPAVPSYASAQVHQVTAPTSVVGGEGYYFVSAGSGYRCSIGFNGYAVASGASEFVTAGHCATKIDGSAYLLSQNAPTSTGAATTVGSVLGETVAGEAQYAAGHDYGIVADSGSGLSPSAAIATWGGGTGAPLASAPLAITGETAAIVGATLCKSGSTSGWTCGTVKAVDTTVSVGGVPVNSVIASTCLLPGDSGGGAVIGQAAAAIDSGSTFGSTCANPDGTLFSTFFPMVSAAGSDSVIGQQGANWELGVSVAEPTISSPGLGASVTSSSSIVGSLANAGAGSTVAAYLDGSSTAFAKVSAASGSWSIPLSGVALGAHSFRIVGGWGTYSVSAAATGTFTMSGSGGTSSGPPNTVRLHDYSGDGHPDIVARNSAGTLMLYKGNGAGGWAVPTSQIVGSGWNVMSLIIEPGDFNGDGHPDILARDKSGVLWLYPGNGSGGWGASIRVGGGWNSMTAIVAVGDFNGDGHADLVARDSTGALWLYPGTGLGGFLPRSQIGSGWNGMSVIIGIGDFNGDGSPDILARNAAGNLMLYPHTPRGWGTVKQVGSGWNGMTALSSVGDFNGDGAPDIIARNSSGVLWMYPGSGTGSWKATVELGTGWNQFTAIG